MTLVAYLDPGAGSMAIQMVIAAVLTVPFFLRAQISQAVAKLRGRGSRPDAGSQKD
jgi:hypothetical protein